MQGQSPLARVRWTFKLSIKEYKGSMSSLRRRVSEPGIALSWTAILLTTTRVRVMALTAQMSNFGARGNSPVKGTLGYQIWESPGVYRHLLIARGFRVLGLGIRFGWGAWE